MKDKDNYILAAELEAEMRNGEIVFTDDAKNLMKTINSKNVLVDIFVNVEDDLDRFNIDKELFYNITSVQRIPKKVTLDFLSVKGEIDDNDFLLRLKNAR